MPAGRPTKYDPAYVDQVYRLALLGLTDAEIADFFQVHQDTLYAWDAAHPEFSVSRARGKLNADAEVAEKLYHRAKGYSHDAVKIFMPAGANEPVYAPYTEHYPPDTQAASLWLRNRQAARWKERVEQVHSGEMTVHKVIAERPMTEEEWARAHAPDDAG